MAVASCTRSRVTGRRVSAYFALGLVGYAAGLITGVAVATVDGLALAGRLIVAIVPPVAFLLFVQATVIALGRERIVFYEKAIACVATAAVGLALAGEPVAAGIDAVTIAVATFLVFGRVGCFRVGCCHGRPARRGVRYGRAQVEDGFTPRLAGVPLVPVQLVDSAISAAGVAAALVVWWRPHEPGVPAVTWAAIYAVGRFAVELARGDVRPSRAGLSEAQWTSLVVAGVAALWRPSPLTALAAVAVALAAVAVATAHARRWPRAYWLAAPAHAAELASILDRLDAAGGSTETTAAGLRVSLRRLGDGSRDLVVSETQGPPSWLEPVALRRLIAQLGGGWRWLDLVAGQTPGLVHVLLARDSGG